MSWTHRPAAPSVAGMFGAPVLLAVVSGLALGLGLIVAIGAQNAFVLRQGLAVTVGTCLALTWLNPHVYLDTVVLLGSMASTYGAHRWAFAAGAGLGSVVWFTALGFGARLLRPVFARPAAWRALDAVIAVVMVCLGV